MPTKIDIPWTVNTVYNTNSSAYNGVIYSDIDKSKEMIEKLEKHIDELEEDIEFFNKQREETQEKLNEILEDNAALRSAVYTLTVEVNDLKAKFQNLSDFVSTNI